MEYINEPKWENKYVNSLNKFIYEVAYDIETRLTLNPKYINFRVS